MLNRRNRKMRVDFIIFIVTSFPDFHVTSARVKDLKITMARILSVATAGVCREQLADIDHHRFPRVDYIELQHLLNAETLDYSSYYSHSCRKIFTFSGNTMAVRYIPSNSQLVERQKIFLGVCLVGTSRYPTCGI
jgi:hypothetical protein